MYMYVYLKHTPLRTCTASAGASCNNSTFEHSFQSCSKARLSQCALLRQHSSQKSEAVSFAVKQHINWELGRGYASHLDIYFRAADKARFAAIPRRCQPLRSCDDRRASRTLARTQHVTQHLSAVTRPRHVVGVATAKTTEKQFRSSAQRTPLPVILN